LLMRKLMLIAFALAPLVMTASAVLAQARP